MEYQMPTPAAPQNPNPSSTADGTIPSPTNRPGNNANSPVGKQQESANADAVWAQKVDHLFAETHNDPRKRAEGLAQLKAQYLYETFGIQTKIKE